MEKAVDAAAPRTDPLLESLLAQCAQEPIHIPGSIQAFGVLLIWDSQWRLEAFAVGQPELLPRAIPLTPGLKLETLFGSEAVFLRTLAQQVPPGGFHLLALPANDRHPACEGRLHTTVRGWMIELWPIATPALGHDQTAWSEWLNEVEQGHELLQLAERLCVEVRRALRYDRVLVYRFDADANGEVIAEAVREDWPSFRGLWYPASDIPAQARELYLRNRVRLLVDRDAATAAILPATVPQTGEAWDLSLCLLRSMSPVHLLYLRNMGVAASLVASVVVQGRLWGLIACHHGQPYLPPQGALELINNWASLLGLAIERHDERQRHQGIQRAQQWLKQALMRPLEDEDWTQLLIGSQAGLLQVIPADGIALVRGARVYRQRQTPDEAACLALRDWLNHQSETVYHTDRLGQVEPAFASLVDVAAGIMALRLPQLEDSWLIWFRGELRQQVRWAGDPKKPLGESNAGLGLQPRSSFEAWQAEVAGRSRAWSATEEAICREAIRLNLLNVLVDWQERHMQRLSAYQQVLLEQVGDAIYLLDAHGVVQYVNPAAEQLFGCSLYEAVGRPLVELCQGPPHRAELEAILQKVQQGETWQGERLCTRGRAGPRWVDSRFQRIDVAAGQSYGIIEISRDASRRKQAELELQEREQRLRTLIERIGAGIVVFRCDGSVRMANHYAAGLLQLSYQEVMQLHLPQRFVQFYDEKGQPFDDDLCIVQQCFLKKQTPHNFEVGFYPPGQTQLVWLTCHLEPEFDEQGQLLHLIWTFSDSTQRHLAVQSLREREEMYRLLAENATDLITAMDSAGRLVYVSPMSEHLIGLTPEQMIGVPWESFVHPEDQAAWLAFLHDPHGTSRPKLEYRIVQASGQTRWVETSANLQANSSPPRIVCVTRDIEERRNLQEQQRRLEKFEALGSLAGQVAHDFNNLLTVVIGACSEGLLADDPRQALHDILKAAEQGRQLTRKLLSFSRTQPLRCEELPLEATIRGLLSLLERLVGVNMQIVLELHTPLAAIWADQGQFEQALLNLVSNARDAMSQRGTLRIRTRTVHLERGDPCLPSGQKPGVYTQLSVIDQGCGMDEATQKRIFEPFFTTKVAGKGTGLGLSIVQHLVTTAQGFVRVESQLQQGTSVHLYFPFRALKVQPLPVPPSPHATQSKQEHAKNLSATGKGQRILLVEDNHDLRLSTARLLQQAGYVVQAVETPNEALQQVEQGLTFDLLLSDVVLPGMTGPELAKRLAERLPGLPVLFMSGFAPEASLEQGLPLERDNFLQKPFAPAELFEAIRSRFRRTT